jgi:single-stranded-DNA-specific exonuclease
MSYAIRRQLSNEEQAKLAGFSPLLAHLLHHRGLTDAETAQKFLAPDYVRDTHDPFLLKGAEKAAERVIKAIQNDERIAIYADYDADGIPGAVIWNDFFQRIGFKNFSIYIPHRHDEGFGLNIAAVDHLALHDAVELLITVDCGISDVKPVERANELGMEVIITDHHEPPVSPSTGRESLPPAFAIIDHKQIDCAYPDKNICGSGVAFKLIQAILKKSKEAKKEKSKDEKIFLKEGHEKWLLDMVGLATLSDMVPLVGENRVFAYYGLQVLRKSPRKGLIRLLEKLKIAQKHITEDDIAFMVTLRINAASRMGLPMDAFSLLAADNDADARKFTDHLDAINNERKGVVASLVKEVKKTLHGRHGHDAAAFPSVIVLGNPEWRPSLLGLVANTCAGEFSRPVFLWGRDGDNAIKGSCRSEGQSNVVELMRAVPAGVLTQFGGHRYSGGFAVANESVHFLEKHLTDAKEKQEVRSREKGESAFDGNAEEMIDAELSIDDVDWNLQADIAKLAPFGTGNPKPVFLFKKVAPISVRRFGKGNEHIELTFKKKNGVKIPAISFFGIENEWAKKVEANKPIDLIASVEKSMFRGRAELRLRVIDIHVL